MGPHPADEHVFNREFYDDNQAVAVSSDVEDVVLISYIIGGRETGFYFQKISPFRLLCDLIPAFKSYP